VELEEEEEETYNFIKATSQQASDDEVTVWRYDVEDEDADAEQVSPDAFANKKELEKFYLYPHDLTENEDDDNEVSTCGFSSSMGSRYNNNDEKKQMNHSNSSQQFF
jgi:hypothetical protein